MEQNWKEHTKNQRPADTWLYRIRINTRLWWTEVLRGALTLTFGILYLCLQNLIFALIYILGAYLLCDGVLDLYRALSGKFAPQRRLYYLGAGVSILIGLLSLIAPAVTLLISGLLVATMVTLRGVQVVGDMVRTQEAAKHLALGLWRPANALWADTISTPAAFAYNKITGRLCGHLCLWRWTLSARTRVYVYG